MERGWVPCWPVWSGGLSWLVLLYLSPCTCAWSRTGRGSPSAAPDWRGGWVGSVHACSLAGWAPVVHLYPERGLGSSRQSNRGAGSAGTEPQPGLKQPAGCVTLECHPKSLVRGWVVPERDQGRSQAGWAGTEQVVQGSGCSAGWLHGSSPCGMRGDGRGRGGGTERPRGAEAGRKQISDAAHGKVSITG